MRRSRKKKPKKALVAHYNINYRIEAPEVRVIDAEGKNVDVMATKDAIALAKEKELDLVEINPKANPPVAQILDFKHFKYQKEKEARKQRSKQHISDIKGIRLSIRIGPGDLETRKKQALRFLERGDKVKTEIILRGAERYKTPLAYDVTKNFYATISEEMKIKYEQIATRQGNKVTSIIVRDN